MIYYPCAKINVGLDVLVRRSDGFHNIESILVPVSGLCDILEIVPQQGQGVEFSVSGLDVNCLPEENLCVRAYNLIRERFGIGGVLMHLHKIIPSGAGLGGGSADAAQTIKGLNQLFELKLSQATMEQLAAELGSDTVFFMRNTAQLVQGRGERLSPSPVMEQLKGKLLVVVKPDLSISTAEAYSRVVPAYPEVSLFGRAAADIEKWKGSIKNDFETHMSDSHPIISEIKELLYRLGAVYASMSGSGSALYGLFDIVKMENLEEVEKTEDAGNVPPFSQSRSLSLDILINEVENSFIKHFVYQAIIE